jgi:MHS family proline/betaine transporter-like MFS transporter
VLARLFFPSDDPLASLIGAYGSFAVGFAMRPIGAAVLGTVGDCVGRRFVLLLSVTLTAIALLLMNGLLSPVQFRARILNR